MAKLNEEIALIEYGIAYERGDYKTAVEGWRPFAEQGNADAQCNLGAMYLRGKVSLKTIAKGEVVSACC